jgi:tRNA dimethylallyltransferase
MSWDAVLIAGPTASGKSALAMALAEAFGGAVINADSMQVYRELRVLTARPAAADEARVPHRLYGHVPIAERYSAGRYMAEARDALVEMRAAGVLPIFTGGTGLYFRVLTDGLSPIPAVPQEIRERCRARLQTVGAAAFFAELAARDPETAAQLRAGDTQRVLRAASVLEATGRPLRLWQQTQGAPVLAGLRVARFVLSPPREALYARIDARFAAMLDQGALDEVRALASLDPTLPAARALGVPRLLAHIRGELTREEALAAGQGETRRYAKRQLTWFRRFMRDWKWLEKGDFSNIVAKTLRSGA